MRIFKGFQTVRLFEAIGSVLRELFPIQLVSATKQLYQLRDVLGEVGAEPSAKFWARVNGLGFETIATALGELFPIQSLAKHTEQGLVWGMDRS